MGKPSDGAGRARLALEPLFELRLGALQRIVIEQLAQATPRSPPGRAD